MSTNLRLTGRPNQRSKRAQHHQTSVRYGRLLAIGLSLGCSFSTVLSALFSARPAIAQPSQEVVTAIDSNRSKTTLINIRDECNLSEADLAAESADEVVQTLLSEAVETAAQTEDPSQRARAFERIGESYACLGQNEQADSVLQQSIAAAEQIGGDYAQNYREGVLQDVAEVYGRFINDVEQMNAVLAGLLAAVEMPYPYVRGGSYSLVRTAARLYSETGQYQKLRELMDQTDGDEYRLDLITEVVPTLRRVESAETQAVIATLFSEFDLDDLYNSVPTDAELEAIRSAPPRGFTPSIIYAYSFYRYNPKEIEGYSPAAITELVNEESSRIEHLEGGELEQLRSYQYLGEFLADSKQPEAALAIFETVLGQAAEIVEAQTNPDFDAAALAYYREQVRVPIAYALVQLGSIEPAMQTLIGLDDENSLSLSEQIKPALRFAQSESLDLSAEQRLDIVSGAEAILIRREDSEKTELLIDLANAYAEIGEAEKASILLPAIFEALPEITETFALAEKYSKLLVMIGDYDGVIAFVQAVDSNILDLRLPAQFVAAGQYEQAEALLEALPTETVPVTDYFAAAGYMIDEFDSADEGYAFTVQTLEKIENADLATDESYQQWQEQYPGDRFTIYTESARAEISRNLIQKHILSLDPDARELRLEFLTADQKTTIQQLIDTLENDWLRAEILKVFFSPEEALQIIDSDTELSALDNLLLRRVVQLVAADEFEQAVGIAERVRSPYIRSRALTHIANGHISPDREVQE